MPRPYANVVISDPDTLDSKAFFVLQRDGTIREIVNHNVVSEYFYLESVSFAAYIGLRVDYYICDADFNERQHAKFTRTR